jgi:hypothetical protein
VPVVHVICDTRPETDPRQIHPTDRKRRQPDLSVMGVLRERSCGASGGWARLKT